jgi:hypothetical protein
MKRTSERTYNRAQSAFMSVNDYQRGAKRKRRNAQAVRVHNRGKGTSSHKGHIIKILSWSFEE